jgi:hypothetical protein
MKLMQHLLLASGVILAAGFPASASAQVIAANPRAQPPQNKVTGLVTDASGAPAAGVQMMVMPNYGMSREVTTGADGRYELTWQTPNFGGGFYAGDMTYSLLARDLEHNVAAIHDIDEKTTNLDLRLEPGIILAGRVEDTNGRPITNASAFVMVYSGDSGSSLNPPSKADADGRVEIKAMPQGRRYGLYASAQGYGTTNQEVQAGNTKTTRYEFPKSVLKTADHKLAGQVLDGAGQPVSGAQVNFYGDGQPGGNTRADDKGRFSFDKVADGRVSLQANAAGAFGNAQARADDTNVTIRINPNGGVQTAAARVTTTGKITDPSGAPAAGVSVRVMPANGVNQNLKTDAEGKFSISWQPLNGGGGFQYSLVARDAARNLAVVAEVDPDTTNKDAQLRPGLTLSGSVQDGAGAMVPSATVSCSATVINVGFSIENQPIRVDAQGAFEITALPQGVRYNLSARAAGYGQGTATVQPDETRTDHVKVPPIICRIADKVVSGKVLGPDDKPVSGATVRTVGMVQGTTPARSDNDGHFELKVVEGSMSLMASAPGMDMGGSSVRAKSGDTGVVLKMVAAGGRTTVIGGRQAPARTVPLKPQPWTLASIKGWPAAHKSTIIVLISVQVLVLTAVAGGIFWFTSPKRP